MQILKLLFYKSASSFLFKQDKGNQILWIDRENILSVSFLLKSINVFTLKKYLQQINMKSKTDYIPHLAKDKKLKKIVGTQTIALKRYTNVCIRLCASIMSQQLSTKVADIIYQRFLNLFNGAEPIPEMILKIKPATLRSIGLSNAKVSYVHNVARFAVEIGMDAKLLSKMSNEKVIEYLTQIKGVGQWTVEMLLMFTLGREDVFAVDDLGIQNSMIEHYKLDRTDKKKFRQQMLQISAKWSPYRTYACLHLWQWKDTAIKTEKSLKTKAAKKSK